MAGTDISDNLLTSGTNQGIERAVLPMPQLNIAFNVRMRKASRWGKRYGHTAISTTNLGTGTGLMRAVGGARESCFAIADDRCCSYNRTAAAFVAPSALAIQNTFSSYVANPRIPGAVTGWLPDTSFFPVPPRAPQGQTTTPCSSAYGIGYLWTAIQFKDPINTTDTLIRVVATDPNDQTVVFLQEIVPTNLGFGGVTYPKLVVCGTTVIVTYLYAPSAGALQVNGRVLTTLAGGFGADTAVISGVGIVSSYDASVYSSTQFLVTFAASSAGCGVQLMTTAFATAASQAITDGAGAVTLPVVVGSTGGIYVGYVVTAGPTTKLRAFTAGLGAATGTATLSAAVTRPLLCLLSSGVRAVYGIATANSTGGYLPSFRFRDVSSAGALVTAYDALQWSARPLSTPFLIGSQVYMWTTNFFNNGFGYANLIRLPAPTDFATVAGGAVTCPIEMSVQDYVVCSGQSLGQLDIAGLSTVSQLGTTASYAATIPTLLTLPPSPGIITFGMDFRVIQAKHYTDSASQRSLQVLPADLSSFVPAGTLTRIDDRGAIEEGFVYSPTVYGLTPSAGGAMTASSDYYYTAVYRSRGANGRLEVSAPATPVKVTMGVGQTQVALQITTLDLTARQQMVIDIYRSLANTQSFYYVNSIDGGAAPVGNGNVSYNDVLGDAAIQRAATLYIQVGQTLANAFPPASRFGCVGGQRLFLGGLIRPDVIQSSKLIFGDQSPSFADNDAFRIVVPAPVTGLAWMDSLTIFTAEGIYVASGDGPDDSGNGDFGTLTRMPYQIGCIEPRSVFAIDDGVFFQTPRGLYLLPRGFGAPVPAGDNVMDSLQTFSVITGVAVLTKNQEQSVVWTCSNTNGTLGVRIVYDMAHKVWSVDSVVDSSGNAAAPCGIGQWFNNEIAQFMGTTTLGLQSSTSLYADPNNTPISMEIRTGDLRPFGTISEGVISKADMLAELRSACTLSTMKTTEFGTFTSQRVFALAAGDYQVGDVTVTETELGAAELRDAMSLRLQYDETSTTEGVAFIALSIEHEQGEGLKRVSDLSRNT